MTEVRFRPDYESESAHVADVPLDQLDSVIPTLSAWGVEPFSVDGNLYGQFAYDNKRNTFVFEVILDSGGDE